MNALSQITLPTYSIDEVLSQYVYVFYAAFFIAFLFTPVMRRVATYFNITDDEAYSLYEAAELVVRERFQGHLDDIAKTLQSAATSRPSFLAPHLA